MKQENLTLYAPFESELGSGSGSGDNGCFALPEVTVEGASLNTLTVRVPSVPNGTILQLEFRLEDEEGFQPIGEPVNVSQLEGPGPHFVILTDLEPCCSYWLRWTQLQIQMPTPVSGSGDSGAGGWV